MAVDRQRAADLGVRIGDLARALRLMVSGQDEISSYREKGERYPVTIRVREDQRSDMHSIGGLMVPSTPRRAGAGRQRGVARARLRPDDHPALQPAVLDARSSPTSSPGSRWIWR